jgi:hypothetical protein
MKHVNEQPDARYNTQHSEQDMGHQDNLCHCAPSLGFAERLL